MKKIRYFTVVVFGVAIVLTATAFAISVLLPPRLQERAEDVLASKARSTAEYVAAYARAGLVAGDTLSIRDSAKLVRLDRELAYAVVLDQTGIVIASTGVVEPGTRWSDSKLAAEPIESVIPIVIDGWMAGRVHVAMSSARIRSQASSDRALVLGFSGFLLLLSLGTGFGVSQMRSLSKTVEEWQARHQSVRLHAGSLQSSVREHRQTEATLKMSEEKYRSLFESTMESAMRDLEDLNRHLERRKADLEHEVGVRKKAESGLRRYAERLQLLNDLERLLLEGDGLEEAVATAMEQLDALLGLRSISLVERDLRKGSWQLLGAVSAGAAYDATREQALVEDLKNADGQVVVQSNLSTKDARTRREHELMEAGASGYGIIPMTVKDESVGVLVMTAADGRDIGSEELSIARDVADLLAIGIHNNRLDSDRQQYELELISARDRAEDMARLKSAFLTNMSHEFRTPISGIMGFAQVLHEEVPDGLREFTGLIRESSHRLLNTINSVLELARLESGRNAIEPVALDFAEATEEAIEMLAPSARRKGLEFRFERPDEAVWCYLDRACVERIVTNLVDNAIKFTDGGMVRVSIERNDGNARLKVSDTGVGMSESFLPRLFDEFRQEQMDANREHEGSGLGLAITKKLVDRLGGLMSVESRKGIGTTFTVEFGLLARDQSVTDTKRDLLLVTASAIAGDALRDILGDRFNVTIASSRDQAGQLVRTRHFQHAIVDVNAVPEAELASLTRALRETRPGIQLLAVATQIVPERIEDVLRAGVDQFVHDTYNDRELLQALIVEERSDREPVPASGAPKTRAIADRAFDSPN